MTAAPTSYSLDELAALIGRSRDWLYRHRRRLEDKEGLPKPILPGGRMRWHRASIDAWLARHHPQAQPLRAANDDAAPVIPAGDGEWTDYLARCYGGVP